MAISEYPLPSVNSSYPRPQVFYEIPQRFQVGVTQYDDGGIDTIRQNGSTGIRRWAIEYTLNLTEAAILDAHALAAYLADGDGPSAETFNLRDRDTAILYSGVRYARYERGSHRNKQIQTRRVELVKYP